MEAQNEDRIKEMAKQRSTMIPHTKLLEMNKLCPQFSIFRHSSRKNIRNFGGNPENHKNSVISQKNLQKNLHVLGLLLAIQKNDKKCEKKRNHLSEFVIKTNFLEYFLQM